MPDPGTGGTGDDVDPVQPGGTREARGAGEPGEPEHRPEGLDLARETARAVARAAGPAGRRRRRGPPSPVTPSNSGSHPDDRDPQLLSRSLERLVEAKGWSTEVSVHTLLGRWPALVGEVNAQHVQPVGYADGVLTVQADSTVWATQLRTVAPTLVAKLNQALGQGTVTKVVVRGPDVPSWNRGRRRVRDGRGPRDTYG